METQKKEPTLEQRAAIEAVLSGRNVFLTGDPGTGKSFTLECLVAGLIEKGLTVAVTASTGAAALPIAGKTIHSWSGIGIMDQFTDKEKLYFAHPPEDDRKKLYNAASRAMAADILIIDEISMLSQITIDLLDHALKTYRKSDTPFGGLQVVLVGDFHQLPPVTKPKEKIRYAFFSPAWESLNLQMICLKQVHRQENDEIFLELLKNIRNGIKTPENLQILNTRIVQPIQLLQETFNNITRLYCKNVDVDVENDSRLEKISSPENIYTMFCQGEEKDIAALKKNCPSPEILKIKIGALVMCTQNDWSFEGRYVNGTTGIVTGFNEVCVTIQTISDGKEITIQRAVWEVRHLEEYFDDQGQGKKIKKIKKVKWVVDASVSQIPLKLAWAISIHKSQGATLPAAIVDISNTFSYGQAYVALSRVKELKYLYILGLNDLVWSVSQDVLDFDKIHNL